MHDVSLHSEQKQYDEFTRLMKIKSNPNPLAIFIQQQISKLNEPDMEESKSRSLRAIDNLNNGRKMEKEAWCTNTMVMDLLPTLHPNANFWNHSIIPLRSPYWITTNFTGCWLTEPPGQDVVFNGTDHFLSILILE
jgi:hypothetical protein